MGQQFGPHFAELMTENLSALSFDMRKLAGLEAIEEMKASFSIPAAITSEISEQIRSQTAAFSALRAMPPVTLTFPTLKAADQVRAFTSSSELVDAFRKAFPTPITVDLPSIEFVENTELASEMARTAAAQVGRRPHGRQRAEPDAGAAPGGSRMSETPKPERM